MDNLKNDDLTLIEGLFIFSIILYTIYIDEKNSI